MFSEEGFLLDILVTLFRITSGFLLSVACALPLGVLIARSKSIDDMLSPILSFVRYLPVPALIPISILWFGVGETQKIMIVFIGVFFQLVFLVSDAVRNVPLALEEIAKTFGARPRTVVFKVVLPYSSPAIFDHCRVTVGWAWGWVMLAELVGAHRGIGFMIVRSQRVLNNDHIIAALLILGVLGVITDYVFILSGKRVFRWWRN